jgi:aminoglycoside 3-N-acetyltransferase I
MELFQIKRLSMNDMLTFQNLVIFFREVFEMSKTMNADQTNLKRLLEKDDFIAIAILHEGDIVGGLTAYELPMYYSDRSEIFVYDVAIKAEFQRRGLGKKLISALKEHCIKNGIEEFFVQAHEEDEYALEFYGTTGGRAERIVQFIYSMNK